MMQEQIVLLSAGFVLPFLLRLIFPLQTGVIIADFRIARILHYVALSGLGIALAARELPGRLETERMLNYGLFIMALVYAAVFAVVTNDLEDVEADRISNKKRPLVAGTITRYQYLIAGVLCLVVALLLAGLSEEVMFFGVLGISLGYWIYSCRPFRLKRIPLIAKLLIGLNSLIVALTGYVLAGGVISGFPLVWIFYIVVPLSLAANFVDLKDTEGDGRTGVKTLPVMFGLKKARQIIVFFTLLTYAMGGLLLGIVWVYPLMVLLAGLHTWLLYRQPYQERWVFMVYLSALFGLDVFLILCSTNSPFF